MSRDEEDTRDIFDKALDSPYFLPGAAAVGALAGRKYYRDSAKSYFKRKRDSAKRRGVKVKPSLNAESERVTLRNVAPIGEAGGAIVGVIGGSGARSLNNEFRRDKNRK